MSDTPPPAMRPVEGTAVFIDADILLHFPPLDQLKWRELLPDQRITIVIPYTVLNQIDRKKNDARLRDRATRVISDIRRFKKQGFITTEIPLVLLPHLQHEATSLPQLDPSNEDDQILASIVAFRALHPASGTRLASGDYVMELKCDTLGIPFVAIDATERLPPLADDHTKRIRSLEAELLSLKARSPIVSISATCPTSSGLPPPQYQTTSTTQRGKALVDFMVEKEIASSIGSTSSLGRMDKSQRAEWDTYITEYRKHVELAVTIENARNLIRLCRLSISNTGKAPATFVDARVRFPDLVNLLDSNSDIARILIAPTVAPRRPVSRSPFSADHFLGDSCRAIDLGAAIQPLTQRDNRVPEVTIVGSDSFDRSHEIRIRLARLQHGDEVFCRDFFIMYHAEAAPVPLQLTS